MVFVSFWLTSFSIHSIFTDSDAVGINQSPDSQGFDKANKQKKPTKEDQVSRRNKGDCDWVAMSRELHETQKPTRIWWVVSPQGGNLGAREATNDQLMSSASSQPSQRKMGGETHKVPSSLAELIHDYAKSLQSCPTLCDPIDGSPPGSPIPGILQARTLERVAISFSNAWKWKVEVKSLKSCPTLLNPMDCSLPDSSVHGIFQARVLEWGAIAYYIMVKNGFPKDFSDPMLLQLLVQGFAFPLVIY